MARIAALVVAYFSADDVRELAANLAAPEITGPHHVDVYVIDNSEDAAELDRLRAVAGVARLEPSRGNVGYGAGMNALAEALDEPYDWIMICNPDIRFEAGSIDALVRATDAHPDAALWGPRLVGDDGLVYPSARAFPSIRTGVGHALFANIWRTNPWTLRYHQSRDLSPSEDSVVDWVSGACMLVRPEAFRAVGGFDDSYFMYFEDVDLAWRLAARGWRAVYVPRAHILHSGAKSTSRQASYMRQIHHQSAQRYLSRKYAGWHLAPVRLVLRIGLWFRREFLHR
ncbi:glycosyltransferase [Galbitalea soli]|uniref:Glycosyltransferase family 2 protein n=1 Tax=Galbitalea soli TaxID=1268042 RepID=A0A7C9TQI8_9MICO|nr:glycosyltransferase family 2 protein [Galbitalea soli]NYJ30028.1 N-acetylglucosaminyl-diphospho-decaprenol L-rhamnosyltransferase [Galbitalea soli]